MPFSRGSDGDDVHLPRATHARVLSRVPAPYLQWRVCEQIYFHLAVIGTRVDPRVYIRRSHRAAETPTFRSKQNDLCARSARLDLSSLLPPSFDLETPESINGASDFTFLECRGCADHSVIRADFPWDFRETRRYRKILTSMRISTNC